MWENITSTTKGDATWEIITMLLVSFILGYLLRYLLGSGNKGADTGLQAEINRLRSANAKLQTDLDACNKRKTGAGVAAAAAVAAVALPKKPANPDDLKKIEGIGPAIEKIFNNGGVWTWSALADAPVDHLKALIQKEWPNNKVHDPTTWPKQAAMARDGKWAELEKWQDELKGGK